MIPSTPRDTGCGRIVETIAPSATYYETPSGDRWRVHDCVFEGGRFRRVELESREATRRVFVAATGVRKVYQRAHRERFKLTPCACERQLQEAEYLPMTGAFNSAERTPR